MVGNGEVLLCFLNLLLISTCKLLISFVQLLRPNPGLVVTLKQETLTVNGENMSGQGKGGPRDALLQHPWPCMPRGHILKTVLVRQDAPRVVLEALPSSVTPPWEQPWSKQSLGRRGRCPLTWEAVVPAALHVERGQVQPNPSHLLEQPVPELIHHHGILTVQLGRGGHEAPENGVDATWWREI